MNPLITAENQLKQDNEVTRSDEQLGVDEDAALEKIGTTSAQHSMRPSVATASSPKLHDKKPLIDPEREHKRLEALRGIFGLWANRDDIPKDGVEYQRQLRSEWE